MDLDISLLSPVPCLLIRLGNRLGCCRVELSLNLNRCCCGDCTIGMHLVNGSFSGHKKISEINIVLYAEPENTIRQEIMNLVMHCFWSSSTSSPPPSPPLLLNIQFNVAFPFLALLMQDGVRTMEYQKCYRILKKQSIVKNVITRRRRRIKSR